MALWLLEEMPAWGLSLKGWGVAQCGVLAWLCQVLAPLHYSGEKKNKLSQKVP